MHTHTHRVKGKKVMCLIFTSWPFQPMADLPRGGGVKESTSPVKQQERFEPGTFGPQSNALPLNHKSLAWNTLLSVRRKSCMKVQGKNVSALGLYFPLYFPSSSLATPLCHLTCSFVQRGLYERISSLQGTPFPLLYQCTSEPGLAGQHPGQGRSKKQLIPRPFPPPVFHRFQYEAMKYWQWEWPGNEATKTVLHVITILTRNETESKTQLHALGLQTLDYSHKINAKAAVIHA